MKFLPAVAVALCAALIPGCGRKADNAEIEKQVQERLDEEHAAQQERALHEREAALDEKERVLAEREKQLTPAQPEQEAPAPVAPVTAPPAAVVAQPVADSPNATYQSFYDALAPYGSWIEMPGYGYVWQPQATVQDPGWRPYTRGHWAFTDDGWTWISDEPFGWATYHYGRWMRTRSLNWVWVPGNQWAPGWVSWRFGDDFVGWAPLPPEARFNGGTGIQQWADQQYNLGPNDYTFVPAADFGDDSMASAAIPADENGPVFENSNNITNIYYDSGLSSIICYGPNFDFMRSRSHRPLPPKLRLERGNLRADGNNRAILSGNTLRVTAPSIVATRAPVAPKAVRARVAESRLVVPAGAPNPQLPRATGGMQIPSQLKPVPVPQAAAGNVPAATGLRVPSQMKPVPLSPDVEAQKAHDLQIIQQQQAAEQERQHQQDAQAAAQLAEQKRAVQEARAQRAAEEKAAAEQQAAKAAREQAARQPQPLAIPAGSPGIGIGRGQ